MRKPRLYRRLASAHQFGLVKVGWKSLHLAPDHLLLRASSGFSEHYRRFYFADIEAITICKTMRGIFMNAGFACGLFFSLMPILVTRGPHRAAWVFAGIFVLLLLANVLRGPTCQTQVQTRVQTRPLPLRRVGKAQRVIEQVAPKIREAQADLMPAPGDSAHAVQPVASTVRAEQNVPPPLPGEAAPRASWIYLGTFAVLVLTAVLALSSALLPGSALLAYLTYAAAPANLGLAIVALVRSRGRRIAWGHSPVALTSLVAHGLALPTVYMIYIFVHAIQVASRNPQAPPSPEFQLPISTLRDLPGFTHVLTIYGLFALLLGLTGCVLFVANGVARKPADAPAT